MAQLKHTGFTEDCWFLYGVRFRNTFLGICVHHATGKMASVDFDWQKANNPLLLGWYHTHPGQGHVFPSGTDHRTMRSWVRATEKPMVCGIVSGEYSKCYLFYRGGPINGKPGKIFYMEMDGRFSGSFFVGKRVEAEPRLSEKK